MAFNSIVVGAETYVSIGNGLYQLSTVAFGSPGKLFKFSPGIKSTKNLTTTATITRHLEKDILVGAITYRKKAIITCQMVVPDGFTSTEVSTLLGQIGTFGTPTNIDRLLQGES